MDGTQYTFSDAAGIKELYIHTDYCENTLNNLVLTNPATTFISRQPRWVLGSPGLSLHLSVEALGAGTLQFQWYKDGTAIKDGSYPVGPAVGIHGTQVPAGNQVISGATTRALNITNARTSNAGSYYVSVTGQKGSVTSNTVPVNLILFSRPLMPVSPIHITIKPLPHP